MYVKFDIEENEIATTIFDKIVAHFFIDKIRFCDY